MKCENFYIFRKKFSKSFGVSEFCRTFASAFALKTASVAKQKKEFFESLT